MKTLCVKLADYLEVDGWDLAQTHLDDLEWWADEIWELRSRWSPVGTQAYVTFLVDPQWEGNRRQGQGVWAVGCSAKFPSEIVEASHGGTLRLKASKNEIEEFVKVIEGFRMSDGKV